MELKEALLEGLDYEAWADKRWLSVRDEFPNPDRFDNVYRHIGNSRRIWLERCFGEEASPATTGEMGSDQFALIESWKASFSICDPGAFVSYTTSRGDSHFSTVDHVLRHVINHGTYHRGQLRQMAEEDGVDYPETDMIGFFLEQKA